MSWSLGPVGRAQRARLERLTAATGVFRPEEVATAVELLDASLDGDDDYRFLGAYEGDDLLGYACWGPTPGTVSRADYAPTRAFYERRGYARVATIPGYYAPSDDLVIYLKDLVHGVLARTTA